jgi:hypothetical protein
MTTSKLAFAFLAAYLAAPALRAQTAQPTLSAQEVKRLQSLAQSWFEPWRESRETTDDATARKLNKKLSDAKDKFLKEWETRSKKTDLLGNMADLRAIFVQPFKYPRVSGSGALKGVREANGVPAHSVFIPRNYKPEADSLPSLLVLPGTAGEGWTSSREHFASTWEGSAFLNAAFAVVIDVPAEMDMDPVPDLSQPNAVDSERQRIRQVFAPMGAELKPLNYDRDRLYLDCGRGSSGFGLRLASYFPTRFAALVLRHPVPVTGDMRLGSLAGVPVLLVSTPETKDACDSLAKVLNELEAGKCTILEGKGAYPFKESQADIEAWLVPQKRNMARSRVIVEPNSESFRKVFWVNILKMEPLAGLPAAMRPRFVVEADRSTNRIKIESRGVEQFQLLLNDDLVDLSKEFTIDVNGKLVTQTLSRNFGFMTEQMVTLFDPGWIFTAQYSAEVSKSEKDAK